MFFIDIVMEVFLNFKFQIFRDGSINKSPIILDFRSKDAVLNKKSCVGDVIIKNYLKEN